MQTLSGDLPHGDERGLAAGDGGAEQRTSAGIELLGLILLTLLLTGIGLLLFMSTQELLQGSGIQTPGLCIWV